MEAIYRIYDAPQYLLETLALIPFKHFLNEPNQSKLIGAFVREWIDNNV